MAMNLIKNRFNYCMFDFTQRNMVASEHRKRSYRICRLSAALVQENMPMIIGALKTFTPEGRKVAPNLPYHMISH